MNAELLNPRISLSYSLNDMPKVNSQFRGESYDETENTKKKLLSQIEPEADTLRIIDPLSKNHLENGKRGQIDVIDMSADNTSPYKYLFVYEDRLSRYIVLKAMKSNDPKKIAMHLLDVITIIGLPHILQSGNGRNFSDQVVQELRSLWNGFDIISGDLLQFASSERNFKNIIKSWLAKHKSKTWLESIKFIQVLQNATFLSQDGKLPHESLFKRNVYEEFLQSNHKRDDFIVEEFKFENNDRDNSSISDGDNHEDEISETPADDWISEDEKSREKQPHKCKICPKKYTKLGHLTNHLKLHKSSKECTKCGKKFRSQSLYENHVSKMHQELSETISSASNNSPEKEIEEISSEKVSKSGKRPRRRPKLNGSLLKCSYCSQEFEFPSVLKRHVRSHTNERPYVCKVCNKSFKQLGHLSQHSITHTDYRSLQCGECSIKFDSLDALKIHSQSHSSETSEKSNPTLSMTRLFECDHCKKVFTTKSVLERHIFTHTHERHFECEVCGKRFKQSGHVKSHMLVHTGERKFPCTICPKRFSLANSLKKHMYIHNGDKPYQCDICGARFLEKRNLNGHLMTHTNERPFGCKVCGKRYTLADTLRRHVSAAHEDGRTYQCEICAKMFKQLAHLSVHKKVHNDERPFQCHLCEKNFKHKNVLKSHLAIHANVRPFECDECKATFVRKTNLQTHIASAHMNERPYACTICGKRFKQVSHLNGHIIVHSNSMPYQCDFCDRRCNRLDNLKKHMRLHTNVEIVRREGPRTGGVSMSRNREVDKAGFDHYCKRI
ncbi:zinc finger protein 708-like [Belonocnema kinseyi]|uniref:zinc finger protein 708-like n=1 Tax=Belonocnema kinseyi TaxID=2817044 RepID=UPI00143D5414|nr:zinc finger protein 708-like [Belonocnema kinseyi]